MSIEELLLRSKNSTEILDYRFVFQEGPKDSVRFGATSRSGGSSRFEATDLTLLEDRRLLSGASSPYSVLLK